ncbi:hypothetical protein [Georgenia sp. AZ-5]|uniref:hypothetical protein n=1 Tax=Georgenia sp. AZ-5 TaxID=3367526 RepID=UPI003753EAF3
MVKPPLQLLVEATGLDERLELVEYVESTIESAPIEVSEEQKAMIQARAVERPGRSVDRLDLGELDSRIGSRWK